MFGLTGLWANVVKWLLVAAAVIALFAFVVKGIDSIYIKGKKAGVAEAEATYNEAMLLLQQKLNAKQTKEAQQINERIDQVVVLSQDAVTAVEVYTNQSKSYSQQVMAAIKGKQLVTVVNGNCQFTPDFQDAWNKIRKGGVTP